MYGKGLVVKHAFDDKAYVRCGTLEGFSRLLHSPIQLNTGPNSQFKLPSADYPDPVGYVSPGVILLVNDMKEVEHRGRDKFFQTDVTVSVTCKPSLYIQALLPIGPITLLPTDICFEVNTRFLCKKHLRKLFLQMTN